jgi:transposase InsO family protein
MKKLGLISKIRRGRRLKTNICYNPFAFPNILSPQFTVEESSKVWISGITRIKTANGLLALTIIMDLFDMKIIGWSLSDGQSIKETTIPAWEMAVKNRKIKKELIFHSNHGAQYANKVFTRKLEAYKFIKRSMSPKGNYQDNCISESFFNTLKSDLLDSNMLLSKKQIREKIFEYFENRK